MAFRDMERAARLTFDLVDGSAKISGQVSEDLDMTLQGALLPGNVLWVVPIAPDQRRMAAV